MDRACEQILQAVSEEYGVLAIAISGGSRRRELAEARQMAMYLIREYARLTLVEIGKIFNRDHTTVLYGVRKIRDLVSIDKRTQLHMANLRSVLDVDISAK